MACQDSPAKKVKAQIRIKYDYLSEEDLDSTFNIALSDYLAYRYPSYNNRPSVDELEIDFFVSEWIYKRMIDILDRVGGSNLVSYKENGLSLQWAQGNIDPSLKAQIMPKASVPK